MAEAYTAERLAVWQQRLNLQDWTISIVVARATELKPKTLGNIHWDLPKKSAEIRVLRSMSYNARGFANVLDIRIPQAW